MHRRVLFVLTLLVLFTTTPSQADLIAYWRWEDGARPQDSSGNGFDIFSQNSAAETDVPVGQIPQNGLLNFRSARFTAGARDLVDDFAAIDFAYADAFTIEGWLKPDSITGSSQYFVEKRNTGGTFNTGYAVYVQGDGKLGFFMQNDIGESMNVSSSDIVSITDWTHFAAVYTGNGAASLYMDGVLQGSGSGSLTSGAGFENNGFLHLGSSQFAGVGYAGLLDEVRVSDEALAPSRFLNSSAVPEPSALTIGLAFALFGVPWRYWRGSRLG